MLRKRRRGRSFRLDPEEEYERDEEPDVNPHYYWDFGYKGTYYAATGGVAKRRIPPAGFISWDAFEANRAYGATEYKYNDFIIGASQTNARYTIDIASNWDDPGKPYSYTGFNLHPWLKPGFDRDCVIGTTIELRSLDITVSLQQQWPFNYFSTDKFMMVRLIICLDTEATGPQIRNLDFANGRNDSDVLESNQLLANGHSLYAHYNLDATSRYTVLYDEVHTIDTGKHYRYDNYRFNENAAGRTEMALKTVRSANTNLYKFISENGQELFGNQQYVAAKAEIALATEGTMEGTGVGLNAIDLITTDIPLVSNTTINFKRMDIQPGTQGDGSVVQDQAQAEMSLNPVRKEWAMDTSEWSQKIHIDFDKTTVKLVKYVLENGEQRMYWEDYAIYMCIQVVSRTDAALGLFADSRLTYWDN